MARAAPGPTSACSAARASRSSSSAWTRGTPPPVAGLAYLRQEPAEALQAVGVDAWTAVAIATHDSETDHAALTAALPSAAGYVGLLGARRRLAERLARLRSAGLAEAAIG